MSAGSVRAEEKDGRGRRQLQDDSSFCLEAPWLASVLLNLVPSEQLLKWAESNRICFVLCR